MTRNAQGLIIASAWLLFALIEGSLAIFLRGQTNDFLYGAIFGFFLAGGLFGLASRRFRETD